MVAGQYVGLLMRCTGCEVVVRMDDNERCWCRSPGLIAEARCVVHIVESTSIDNDTKYENIVMNPLRRYDGQVSGVCQRLYLEGYAVSGLRSRCGPVRVESACDQPA